MDSTTDLLNAGKVLPLVEEFYSIQGEGFHTGKPAYFIRIGGCDVGCSWCDEKESWNTAKHPLTSTDSIISAIIKYPAKSVVVTGGEPLMYSMDYLCEQLKENQVKTYLETSGSHKLSGVWDWIALSPKKNIVPLFEILSIANELKIIIYNTSDFEWAEQNARFIRKDCMLYLQPEWSQKEKMLPEIIQYILHNPQWKLSVQTHKYLNIQ